MKTIVLIAMAILSSALYASPASKQRCTGIDSVSRQEGVFNIIHADYAYNYGYTRNEVQVIRIGAERLRNNVFNLDTPGFPTCRGRAMKRLSNLRNGMTRFTATCNGEQLYSITGTCRFVSF